MSKAELTDEALTPPLQENIREERLSHTKKKTARTVKNLPAELRKKEASKPLYLTRYE